ncbi:MAG: rod-binding protein [Campylobacterota bacterium]|nr:rod-binding protein [Campylobacterota bacterium]
MTINNNFLDINTIKSDNTSNLTNSIVNKEDKELKNVCNDFEAFFTKQLLETSLKESDVAGTGVGSDIVKGLYTDALSQKSSGSLGISEMLYKFLSEK